MNVFFSFSMFLIVDNARRSQLTAGNCNLAKQMPRKKNFN